MNPSLGTVKILDFGTRTTTGSLVPMLFSPVASWTGGLFCLHVN